MRFIKTTKEICENDYRSSHYIDVNDLDYNTIWCSDNRLTSLKYAPEYVGEDFICSGNPLTSLKGGPQSVGGGFYCQDNNLTSLEGIPKTIGGDFYISKSCNFSEEYIRSLSDIKGKVIFK